MVGMLQEVLGGDPVAGRPRIARQLQILFQHLVGIAADPQLRPAAVVPLTLVVAPPPPIPWGLRGPRPRERRLLLFFCFMLSVTSPSTVIEMAGQAACPRPCAFCNILERLAAAP